MSKRKDRERAKSGIVFRNEPGRIGGLVPLEEWNGAHTSVTAERQKQSKTDEAIQQMRLAEKRKQAEVVDGKPYYCAKCERMHTKGKIYADHIAHATAMVVSDES